MRGFGQMDDALNPLMDRATKPSVYVADTLFACVCGLC